jgi:hypothetical protein
VIRRTANKSGHPEHEDRPENPSWPKPEEGLRLMRAFLYIKQAKVREAIIRYVEEQSKLYER